MYCFDAQGQAPRDKRGHNGRFNIRFNTHKSHKFARIRSYQISPTPPLCWMLVKVGVCSTFRLWFTSQLDSGFRDIAHGDNSDSTIPSRLCEGRLKMFRRYHLDPNSQKSSSIPDCGRLDFKQTTLPKIQCLPISRSGSGTWKHLKAWLSKAQAYWI